MSLDKLVDSSQLDTDLTSVANAIRAKSGGSASLAFPAGFVSAVQAIPTGGTPTGTKQISITANGTTTEDVAAYANAEITVNVQGGGGGTDEVYFTTQGYMYVEEIDFPATVTDLKMIFYNTGGYSHLKSISGLAQTTTNAPGNQFRGLSNLKTVNLPRVCHLYATAFRDCKKLETVELGSVGYPVVTTRSTSFQNDTQAFTITMYVNASTLAEAQAISDVGALAPWGATNATIIFKSSTTGEVLV